MLMLYFGGASIIWKKLLLFFLDLINVDDDFIHELTLEISLSIFST